MSKSSYELAVEEAKMWINNNSCHMQDCHEYVSKYMHDLSIVNRISDWNHFRSIVTDLGYDIYIMNGLKSLVLLKIRLRYNRRKNSIFFLFKFQMNPNMPGNLKLLYYNKVFFYLNNGNTLSILFLILLFSFSISQNRHMEGYLSLMEQ